MTYSLPYILLILSFIIIASFQIFIKLDKSSIRYLNSYVGIIFVIFFGFRGFVGWDWFNYYPYFKQLSTIDSFDFTKTSYDVGYSLYSSILKTISPNYNFFIFTSTLFDYILLNLFIKRYLPKHLYAFAFIVFIVMEGSLIEINLLRNVKALLFFLVSLQYIEKRDPIRFLALNLIGLSFHWISIIFFPLYFFLHKKIDLKIFLIIFIIGNIVYLTQISYIQPVVKVVSKLIGHTVEQKTTLYLNTSMYNHQYGITIGHIERFFTSILIMIYYNKIIEKSRSNILFINSFLLLITIYLFFSEVNIIITRIGNLFIFSYWILWPIIIEITKNATKYIIFIFMSIYFNLKIVKLTNTVMYKYDNVLFDQSQSYKERRNIFLKNADKIIKSK